MTDKTENVREVIARASIRGSYGEDAERHAFEFHTGHEADAYRSADAILTALQSAGMQVVEDDRPEFKGSAMAKVMSYNEMHEQAVELGYPSMLEALEDLDRLKAEMLVVSTPSGVVGLVEALEPFARCAEIWIADDEEDDECVRLNLPAKHYRQALVAFRNHTKEPKDDN